MTDQIEEKKTTDGEKKGKGEGSNNRPFSKDGTKGLRKEWDVITQEAVSEAGGWILVDEEEERDK